MAPRYPPAPSAARRPITAHSAPSSPAGTNQSAFRPPPLLAPIRVPRRGRALGFVLRVWRGALWACRCLCGGRSRPLGKPWAGPAGAASPRPFGAWSLCSAGKRRGGSGGLASRAGEGEEGGGSRGLGAVGAVEREVGPPRGLLLGMEERQKIESCGLGFVGLWFYFFFIGNVVWVVFVA